MWLLPVAWDDLVRRPQTLDPAVLGGDFIVSRQGNGPSYQLAVVVDDAAMGVTQVVRGDDLVPSTPRQILLHRALGFEPPEFGHLPLVLGPDGRRLAKRDGSVKLASLRAAGVDARELVGLLAVSLRLCDRVEATLPADWVGEFSIDSTPRESWQVTEGEFAGFEEDRDG